RRQREERRGGRIGNDEHGHVGLGPPDAIGDVEIAPQVAETEAILGIDEQSRTAADHILSLSLFASPRPCIANRRVTPVSSRRLPAAGYISRPGCRPSPSTGWTFWIAPLRAGRRRTASLRTRSPMWSSPSSETRSARSGRGWSEPPASELSTESPRLVGDSSPGRTSPHQRRRPNTSARTR